MDTNAAATALGLHTFDTALPQVWVDDVIRHTGQSPVGSVVWSYDIARIFGAPVAISAEGEALLSRYAAAESRGRDGAS